MAISYEEAVIAQEKMENKILKDPNVVSIGVVEESDEIGRKTGNYVVQVGVVSMENYKNAIKHGKSVIPPEYVLHSGENGSREDKHIKVSVVTEGRIEALVPSIQHEDLPTAIDSIPSMSGAPGDTTLRRRPSPCGHSIGHSEISAGTIGLLLEYIEGPNIGRAYILSNNHVLAVNNLAFVGDAIIQPGKHDSGEIGKDTIATLHRWVPIKMDTFNFVDAAVAEVMGKLDWKKHITPYVFKIGNPGEHIDARIRMDVEKTGRTTGYTQGQVVSINETIKVNYNHLGIISFKNQIRTTSMSKGGDSGSCLFERGTQKPVGLLFAGSETASFFNPLKMVLSTLPQPQTNKYPTGKTHEFPADYSFRILKRHYASQALAYIERKEKRNEAMLKRSVHLPKKAEVIHDNIRFWKSPAQPPKHNVPSHSVQTKPHATRRSTPQMRIRFK